MPRLVGAATGLVTFGAMVVRGWMAENRLEVILSRALAGLFAGVLLGLVSGWLAERVLAEWHATQQVEPLVPETRANEPTNGAARVA